MLVEMQIIVKMFQHQYLITKMMYTKRKPPDSKPKGFQANELITWPRQTDIAFKMTFFLQDRSRQVKN